MPAAAATSLHPARFLDADTAVHAPAGFSGEATFDGALVVVLLDRASLAPVLGSDLVLVDEAATRHPVLFLLGEQRDAGLVFGGRAVPLGVRYSELAVLIPFVAPRGGTVAHVFVAAMCSAYFPAAWHGNVHYGFAKTTAPLQRLGDLLVLASADGRLAMHAAVEPRDRWMPAGACGDGVLADLRALFALPVLGRRADGRLLCTRFAWDFAGATVCRADGWVEVAPGGMGALPAGHHPDVPGGSYLVRGMRWRLGWPAPCVR